MLRKVIGKLWHGGGSVTLDTNLNMRYAFLFALMALEAFSALMLTLSWLIGTILLEVRLPILCSDV